jgi:hypothetical protein
LGKLTRASDRQTQTPQQLTGVLWATHTRSIIGSNR